MCTVSKRSLISPIASVLLALILLGPMPAGSMASPATPDQALAAPPSQVGPATSGPDAPVDCSSTGCPAAVYGDLTKCVERTDFCVYYNTATISEAEAIWAADWVEAYWDRFVDLGFNEPKHSGQLEVYLVNTTADCNGGTDHSWNYMTTYASCFSNDELAQKVLGHELTHRVQYAHDSGPTAPVQTKFLKEGTARASEDNWFDNIDNWPEALDHSSFNTEVNNYLADPNHDITSYDMRYKSCLWWKYGSEQYGTIMVEPERGVDFFLEVYNRNTAGSSGIAAVNGALSTMAPGTTFDRSFRQFAVANWTKDLTGVPDDSYNYFDEEQPGNPAVYGPVFRETGGPILVGTDAQFNNRFIRNYGLRYFEADVDPSCTMITASFHNDDGGPAFYHVVTQNAGAFSTHVEGSGTDWVQSFMNDGVTNVAAIVGSLDTSSQVDITLECIDPVLEIRLPNSVAVAHAKHPSKFLAQVFVTNGSPTAPVVAGLNNSDFQAEVNGLAANVVGGGFVQESYWLIIQAPDGLADGTYDLEVILEDPGTGTPIASDTSPNSVEITTDKVDHVLVLDRSGSMGWPIEPTNDKLIAAKHAASLYVDMTRWGDGLAVVPYNHDINPAPFPMQSVDNTVRPAAKAYIDDWNEIFPDGATSIGDGLFEAVNQRESVSTTGNPLCSFVLLSDGMENYYRYWDDVRTDVQETGCPVTAIAFGPESNETLMQTIATETGGLSYYNDVYVSSLDGQPDAASVAEMNLDMGDTYEYAHALAEGRQRVLAEPGIAATFGETYTHDVLIDPWMTEALFVVDWYWNDWYEGLELKLRKPDGTIIDETVLPYTFEDTYPNGYVGWRISDPDPGMWQMLVRRYFVTGETPQQPGDLHYQALVSGPSGLTLHLLLPTHYGMEYATGNLFPIYGILSNHMPVPSVPMSATVMSPDGTETLVPMFDDGKHGDNQAGDGLYAGVFLGVNQAEPVQPPDEGVPNPPQAVDEGGYRVRVNALGAEFQREALGSFMVLEGDDDDGDGLPDPWEEEHEVDDPDADPDLDCLTNLNEYNYGTDPNDSDTDGGGEGDASEILLHSQDPFDPADDGIQPPDFIQVAPDNGAVQLTYDVKTEHTRLYLARATSPNGPWACGDWRNNDLPLDGAYSDPAANGTTFYYRLVAVDGASHISAVIDSVGVTPSTDPVLPEARIIINGGAPSTMVRDVILTFEPYLNEPEDPDSFSDIAEMMLSNDPSFAGASWQPFSQDVPWVLGGLPDAINKVYGRFKDTSDNESAGTEVGTIFYDPYAMYLPIVIR